MQARKASIKESGEELTASEWERFDAAVAQLKAERARIEPSQPNGVAEADREAQAVA